MPLTDVRFDSLALCLPLAGVREPSDAALVAQVGSSLLVILVDPRGQGQMALVNGRRAVMELRNARPTGLPGLFASLHQALEGTQGVSLGMALIDPGAGRVDFAGIGRVYGAVAEPNEVTVLTSDQGTVGVGLPKSPAIVSVRWRSDSVLALAADGLVDVWDLAQLRRGLGGSLEDLSRRLGGHASRMPEDAALILAREHA